MAIIFIVFVICMVAVIGGLIYFLKRSKKKTAEKLQETTGEDIKKYTMTTQSFLPFENIEDSMIWLKDNQYRMVIEVNSINFSLKTEEEQETAEDIFKNVIASWKFPYAFYIQTREIDNRLVLDNLIKDANSVVSIYPGLSEYADHYIEYFRNINEDIGNHLIKKKYIIVGNDDDTNDYANFSASEKADIAFDALERKCRLIMSGLAGMGISSHVLDSNELVGLLYQTFNKTGGGAIDGIINGDFTTGMVEGYRDQINLTGEQKYRMFIEEVLNKLDAEVLYDKTIPNELKNNGNRLKDLLMNPERLNVNQLNNRNNQMFTQPVQNIQNLKPAPVEENNLDEVDDEEEWIDL